MKNVKHWNFLIQRSNIKSLKIMQPMFSSFFIDVNSLIDTPI